MPNNRQVGRTTRQPCPDARRKGLAIPKHAPKLSTPENGEWMRIKPRFQELYLVENKTLAITRLALKDELDFEAR